MDRKIAREYQRHAIQAKFTKEIVLISKVSLVVVLVKDWKNRH